MNSECQDHACALFVEFLIIPPDNVLYFSQPHIIYIFLITVFHLITAHTPKSAVKQFPSLQNTASVLLCLFLYKGICCGYTFELHRLVDAIQMSTHNICFYNKNHTKKQQQKTQKSKSTITCPSFINLFLSVVPLVYVDTYFTTSFPSNIEKPKCRVR